MYAIEFVSARPDGSAPYYSLVIGQPYSVGSGANCDIMLHAPELPIKFATLTIEWHEDHFEKPSNQTMLCNQEAVNETTTNITFTKDVYQDAQNINRCANEKIETSHDTNSVKSFMYARLYVLPNVKNTLISVNEQGIEGGSSCLVKNNDIVQFGDTISVIFHYRPLIIYISPLDFDVEYRKSLSSMFARLGATVMNNCDGELTNYRSSHITKSDSNSIDDNRNTNDNITYDVKTELYCLSQFKILPIAKFMCVKEINHNSFCLCALAGNFSLVHPTYVFEWFATLAQSASTPLSALPAPSEYPLPIRFYTNVSGTCYLRPESDNCPFSLHSIPTQSIRNRDRKSLFANKLFMCIDAIAMLKYAAIIRHCGGIVFSFTQNKELLEFIKVKDQSNAYNVSNCQSSNNIYPADIVLSKNDDDVVRCNSHTIDTNEYAMYVVFDLVMSDYICEKGLHDVSPQVEATINNIKEISYRCKPVLISEYTFYTSLLSNRFKPKVLKTPKSTLIAFNGQEIPTITLPEEVILQSQKRYMELQEEQNKREQITVNEGLDNNHIDTAQIQIQMTSNNSEAGVDLTSTRNVGLDNDDITEKNYNVCNNSNSNTNNIIINTNTFAVVHERNASDKAKHHSVAEKRKLSHCYVSHSPRSLQSRTPRYSVEIQSTSAKPQNSSTHIYNKTSNINVVEAPVKRNTHGCLVSNKLSEQESPRVLQQASLSDAKSINLMPRSLNRTPSRSQLRSCSRNGREQMWMRSESLLDKANVENEELSTSVHTHCRTALYNTFINGHLIKSSETIGHSSNITIPSSENKSSLLNVPARNTSRAQSRCSNQHVYREECQRTRRGDNADESVLVKNNRLGNNNNNNNNNGLFMYNNNSGNNISAREVKQTTNVRRSARRYANSARANSSRNHKMSVKEIESTFDILRIRIYAFLVREETRLETALSSFVRNHYVETDSMEHALECAALAEEFMEKVNALALQPRAAVYVNALKRFYDDCAALSHKACKLVRCWEQRHQSCSGMSNQRHHNININYNNNNNNNTNNKNDNNTDNSNNAYNVNYLYNEQMIYNKEHLHDEANENLVRSEIHGQISLVDKINEPPRSINIHHRRRKHRSQEMQHTATNDKSKKLSRCAAPQSDNINRNELTQSQVKYISHNHNREYSELYKHKHASETKQEHKDNNLPHFIMNNGRNTIDETQNNVGSTINISVNTSNIAM